MDVKFAEFLKAMTTNDYVFRKAVFYLPLVTAACTFILNWLFLDKSISSSLAVTAFVFLLYFCIGLVYQAMRRRNLH